MCRILEKRIHIYIFSCGALRRILRILKGIMPLSGVLRGSAPKRSPERNEAGELYEAVGFYV